MASKTQETIFEHFRLLASKPAPSARSEPADSDNRAGISETDATSPVIGTLPQNTSSGSSSTGGTSAFSFASEVFGSGFGVVPLVTGLLGLFSGGRSSPPPLTKYVMPQSLSFSGADIGNGIAEASYDQTGIPRLSGSAVDGSTGTDTAGSGRAATSSPQINVTVQAMDAQSFLDRSDDIAQAVRQAMLNLSSINDVVNEL